MRFANQIAIVTGGGGEIGRATALRLAREGAMTFPHNLAIGRLGALALRWWKESALVTTLPSSTSIMREVL